MTEISSRERAQRESRRARWKWERERSGEFDPEQSGEDPTGLSSVTGASDIRHQAQLADYAG